jgi:bifunctional DNase/RNase
MMGAILKEKPIIFLAMAGLLPFALTWLCGETMAMDFAPGASEQNGLLQVKVHRLIVDSVSKQPVVILADSLEERALPIWIDFFEANAINSELKGVSHFRPLTHDLLQRIMQKADIKIHRIVVTHLKEGVYYATIQMEQRGSLTEIDARPSDSIVMALKFKAPIFVSASLFRDKGIPLVEPKEIEEDYGLTLQDLTPPLAESFSFKSKHGIIVSDVRKGSRAEKDGIERGDIFVEVGGQAIEDVMSMRNALKKGKTPVQAKIFRKARFLSIALHPN